jgi:mannose-6-phosphate isomerase-like protein (cupin superfamily)
MKPIDVRKAFGQTTPVTLGPDTTREQMSAGFVSLASFDQGEITGGQFSGESPWERHVDCDELLYVLEGTVDVTILTDDADPIDLTVPAGHLFVIPRAHWHRQTAHTATVLTLRPAAHGPVSFADDPRTEP